jgi:hypothetical protein
MKYHTEPYIDNLVSKDCASAGYFKLSDFDISGYDYKIKIIGFIGYSPGGPADIYVTSKETEQNGMYVPSCNPYNNWQGKDYGPKHWHINNSYPYYDDCNVCDDNWNYKMDVDKFWCIYHYTDIYTPFPFSDEPSYTKIINSLTWIPKEHIWVKGVGGYPMNWCMHCVIVYWGTVVENTSLGDIKALFR